LQDKKGKVHMKILRFIETMFSSKSLPEAAHGNTDPNEMEVPWESIPATLRQARYFCQNCTSLVANQHGLGVLDVSVGELPSAYICDPRKRMPTEVEVSVVRMSSSENQGKECGIVVVGKSHDSEAHAVVEALKSHATKLDQYCPVSPPETIGLHVNQEDQTRIDNMLKDAGRATAMNQVEKSTKLYRDILALDSRNTEAMVGLALNSIYDHQDMVEGVAWLVKAAKLGVRKPTCYHILNEVYASLNAKAPIHIALGAKGDTTSWTFEGRQKIIDLIDKSDTVRLRASLGI
jgi:hypothetical protein